VHLLWKKLLLHLLRRLLLQLLLLQRKLPLLPRPPSCLPTRHLLQQKLLLLPRHTAVYRVATSFTSTIS